MYMQWNRYFSPFLLSQLSSRSFIIFFGLAQGMSGRDLVSDILYYSLLDIINALGGGM